jgi:hypothetical protein
MDLYVAQHDNFGETFTANEYNEVWSLMDEENYRREICERLDIYDIQLDDDRIPF